jgi:hypothetical protein
MAALGCLFGKTFREHRKELSTSTADEYPHLYDPTSSKPTHLADIGNGFSFISVVNSSENSVLLFGTKQNSVLTSNLYLFNIGLYTYEQQSNLLTIKWLISSSDTKAFTELPAMGNIPEPRQGASLVHDKSEHTYYVFGGENKSTQFGDLIQFDSNYCK